MLVPHRLLPLLKEAEDAAATGGIVAELPVLRQMTKDEFATVLGGVSAEFAALRATLPIYPSPEIQRAWTGNTDTLLLQKTALFSHVCERFSARLRGRPLADARILDYGCGWGPVFVKEVVRRFHAASLISGTLISVSGLSKTGPAGGVCQRS